MLKTHPAMGKVSADVTTGCPAVRTRTDEGTADICPACGHIATTPT
jgi:hypothetical protein